MHDGKNLKGRANDAIASACLYIACRQEGVPRTFKEICAVSKISKKEIGRCFKLILKALETSVDLITTADFMSRFCSNLGLPNSVQRAATHIARKAGELDIVSGRSPISVAAAAIYMASQVRRQENLKQLILVLNAKYLPFPVIFIFISCNFKFLLKKMYVKCFIKCCKNIQVINLKHQKIITI